MTVAKCKELINSIHTKPRRIYMIGGGSLNKYVFQKVNEIGVEVRVGKEPQYSVVNGASLYASWLVKDNIHLLIDVAPLSLGVETMHGMVEWIIHRNSPLPVAKKVVFTNVKEGQTHILFNVVQGEGVMVQDCRSLGKFKVEIPNKPRNTVKVELTFILDANGLLNISCTDLDTDSTYDIQFNSGDGLTVDMVKSIVNRSHENMQDTEEYRKFYKYCEEIDLILRNFSQEQELLGRREEIKTASQAEELLNEIHTKLGGKLQQTLSEVTQTIFDSLI